MGTCCGLGGAEGLGLTSRMPASSVVRASAHHRPESTYIAQTVRMWCLFLEEEDAPLGGPGRAQSAHFSGDLVSQEMLEQSILCKC